MNNPLAADLDHVLAHTRGLWEDLRGERVFITGGTGFFGCWLLESFLWANDHLGLNAQAVVLTRDPEAFQKKAPHLAFHPAVRLLRGDVRDFAFPDGPFPLIIHAATETLTTLYQEQPLQMVETIVQGTRHMLDFAGVCEARRFLFASSGAVYGPYPPEMRLVREDYRGSPDQMMPTPVSIYGEAKRMAELLTALYSGRSGLETTVARCFAFVGPYLPLDTRYAIGNFISDGLAQKPIRVEGDGTPFRSYLYAADLAIWLWTILLRGKSNTPYNVGSEQEITIGRLAQMVAGCFDPAPEVTIRLRPDPGKPAASYLPATERARVELALTSWIDLPDAISRTVRWHQNVNTQNAR